MNSIQMQDNYHKFQIKKQFVTKSIQEQCFNPRLTINLHRGETSEELAAHDRRNLITGCCRLELDHHEALR